MSQQSVPTHEPDLFDLPHEHTIGCFWDYDECRWQCAHPDTEAAYIEQGIPRIPLDH